MSIEPVVAFNIEIAPDLVDRLIKNASLETQLKCVRRDRIYDGRVNQPPLAEFVFRVEEMQG